MDHHEAVKKPKHESNLCQVQVDTVGDADNERKRKEEEYVTRVMGQWQSWAQTCGGPASAAAAAGSMDPALGGTAAAIAPAAKASTRNH